MQGWSALYDQPRALTRDWAHQRIYAPHSYGRLRAASTIPIVVTECVTLAQYYPICWRMDEGTPILVALMGLPPNEYARYPAGKAILPLALQAYPFVVPDDEAIERQQLFVDDTIADKPTDIGAPIVMENGRMSVGAIQRARTALAAGRVVKATDLQQHLPGDELHRGRGEEGDGIGDIRRAACLAGGLERKLRRHALRRQRLQQRGIDQARRDGVDENTLRRQLHRHGAGEADNSGLRGHIMRVVART